MIPHIPHSPTVGFCSGDSTPVSVIYSDVPFDHTNVPTYLLPQLIGGHIWTGTRSILGLVTRTCCIHIAKYYKYINKIHSDLSSSFMNHD